MNWGVILLLVFCAIGAVCMVIFAGESEMSDEKDRLLTHHAAVGKYRVRYPDGQYSQRFSRSVAETYQNLFGGEVILAEAMTTDTTTNTNVN